MRLHILQRPGQTPFHCHRPQGPLQPQTSKGQHQKPQKHIRVRMCGPLLSPAAHQCSSVLPVLALGIKQGGCPDPHAETPPFHFTSCVLVRFKVNRNLLIQAPCLRARGCFPFFAVENSCDKHPSAHMGVCTRRINPPKWDLQVRGHGQLTFAEVLPDCPLSGRSCSLPKRTVLPLSLAWVLFHPWFPFVVWAVFASADKFKMLAAGVGSEDAPDREGQGGQL